MQLSHNFSEDYSATYQDLSRMPVRTGTITLRNSAEFQNCDSGRFSIRFQYDPVGYSRNFQKLTFSPDFGQKGYRLRQSVALKSFCSDCRGVKSTSTIRTVAHHLDFLVLFLPLPFQGSVLVALKLWVMVELFLTATGIPIFF